MRTVLMLVAAGISALASCRSTPDREEELLAADRAFCFATQARRLEGWVEAFDAHGSQFDDQFRPITGHGAIRAHMRDLFVDLRRTLTWEPDAALVSEAGNLGSTTGRWTMAEHRDDGTREITATGRYFDVWRRVDGTWKVVVDIGEADPVPVVPRMRADEDE